jgi:hypothetical protein
MIEVIIDVCATYGRNDDNSFPFGERTSSIIKLNDGTVYYMSIFNNTTCFFSKWKRIIVISSICGTYINNNFNHI